MKRMKTDSGIDSGIDSEMKKTKKREKSEGVVSKENRFSQLKPLIVPAIMTVIGIKILGSIGCINGCSKEPTIEITQQKGNNIGNTIVESKNKFSDMKTNKKATTGVKKILGELTDGDYELLTEGDKIDINKQYNLEIIEIKTKSINGASESIKIRINDNKGNMLQEQDIEREKTKKIKIENSELKISIVIIGDVYNPETGENIKIVSLDIK